MTGEMETVADVGIKVLECPIRVISAVSSETGRYDLLHESVVGIAFSGSFTSAYIVKETIAEVLPKLQFIADAKYLTFAKITEIAFKLYEHAVNKINVTSLGYGNDVDMFLVGRCPASGKLSAYKFFRNPATERLEMTAILTEPGFQYDAIGAGEDRIKERIAERLNTGACEVHFMVLEEIRKLIMSGEIASVGGRIQYGDIENGTSFQVYGVQDFRVKDGHIIPMPATRGIDIESIMKSRNPDDLFVSGTMIIPFAKIAEEEIKRACRI